VQLDWDVSGLNPTEVIGIPSETVQVTAMSTNFVDLENVATASKIYFADRSEGTAAFSCRRATSSRSSPPSSAPSPWG